MFLVNIYAKKSVEILARGKAAYHFPWCAQQNKRGRVGGIMAHVSRDCPLVLEHPFLMVALDSTLAPLV